MSGTAWPAPAKLNLFLHITGRRADGYHLLQTVYQFINLQDEIDFSILNEGRISRHPELLGVAEQDDLVVRAAQSLQQYTHCQYGVEINVKKCIPMGGGLGGGSSDAATTLVALNHLWQTACSVDELAKIGLTLGADVPVFVRAHAAWAEGIGEKITPVEPEECVYLVICPSCSIATTAIFNASELTRDTPAITIRDFLEKGGKNDCEAVVRQRYNEVAVALDWLNCFADARLTGTGACLYAAFPDEEKARQIRDKIPDPWQGFVVRGMNRSPLAERLANEIPLQGSSDPKRI